ncbi:TPA: hypothetical protein RQK93_004714 [Vibrio vulnificus]|uniref:hypothetical protein n=1 Tax=Vibrio vulnificus TaxID=672 RepID=UPI001A30A922|nr:hypothetical protein [Vibrio vulnificus]EGQ9971491.1 hypothetical protein [Vibrio vulnificus]WIL72899.1 hypothetical protein QPX65_07840 [Vibrio vulnificus]HAS6046245.1 hypothetical protein [Vibrio vulnificus]HAS6064833.1 hypothetical protein [Vibrio vulnificus]HAT8507132.1 hypothetical protein [Vibrio vulnificus]
MKAIFIYKDEGQEFSKELELNFIVPEDPKLIITLDEGIQVNNVKLSPKHIDLTQSPVVVHYSCQLKKSVNKSMGYVRAM